MTTQRQIEKMKERILATFNPMEFQNTNQIKKKLGLQPSVANDIFQRTFQDLFISGKLQPGLTAQIGFRLNT